MNPGTEPSSRVVVVADAHVASGTAGAAAFFEMLELIGRSGRRAVFLGDGGPVGGGDLGVLLGNWTTN